MEGVGVSYIDNYNSQLARLQYLLNQFPVCGVLDYT
jgi:hypothetical protein